MQGQSITERRTYRSDQKFAKAPLSAAKPQSLEMGGVISRVLVVLFGLLWAAGLRADTLQDHYPRSYADIIAAAKLEKQLIVYNTVHSDAAVKDVLAAFQA